MVRIKNKITTSILRGGSRAALMPLLLMNGWRRPSAGLPVICYHSIDDSGSLQSVLPKQFERQMIYLAEHDYRTISLGELCRLLRDKEPFPRKTIVLTFDDGYRNNLTVAMPILLRFGFTATIFVVTGSVGCNIGWKRTDDVPDLDIASWEELRAMHDAGMDIQPHTANHSNLCQLKPDEARREIIESKQAIEKNIGKRATLFACPYGETNLGIEKILKEQGFAGAVSMKFGHVRTGDNVFALKRVYVTRFFQLSEASHFCYFQCCLSGTATLYFRIRGCFPIRTPWQRPWDTEEDRTSLADRKEAP